MCLEIHTYNVVVQNKESLYDNFNFFLCMIVVISSQRNQKLITSRARFNKMEFDSIWSYYCLSKEAIVIKVPKEDSFLFSRLEIVPLE